MKKLEHVLIVDDDREIREPVAIYLQRNGMRVSRASSGRDMRVALDRDPPDLIVLDVRLPDADGLSLCRELRAGEFHAIPIVMLSARHDEADRIVGLELGADDYMAKPFAIRELLARIRAVLRRTNMLPPGMRVAESATVLRFGEWRLDTAARRLLDPEGTVVALSGAEYRLLRVFLDHPNRVLTRDQLLNLTQGRHADLLDRSIDLLVSRVRQRLQDGVRDGRFIKTLRNEGYLFSATVMRVASHVSDAPLLDCTT
ncbi:MULTISPECIES: response regulator [Paraburkholderia]|uniref:DNA-binding response regulator n=1 Tax=Paraburkholderia largidicola TaxID=3014751 RepID=A0A7I8BVB0_9BURK|nr:MULTISPECIES: response regulator transcription factor [Paraburkholderia]BCF92582.1 DNA-binding response regulator [Paraburkholderia sp. PGU16]GJH37278.1 response regulator [Paraburkholderia hospita]CAG9261978.1 DNA-binding dual transcriptional regulator OmpR [Paraburkholderia caribensis]